MKYVLIAAVMLAVSLPALAAEVVKLPRAGMEGGKPLMQCLKQRRSQREFAGEPLDERTLANLLWAAFGVNRPDAGKRTAPSAINWQEVDLYVVKADGVWLYHAPEHALEKINDGDHRQDVGAQKMTGEAALNLIYVADYDKMTRVPDARKPGYALADTAFIGQNVYLFCASEDLATVIIATIHHDKMRKALKLRATQHITLAQPVGKPK